MKNCFRLSANILASATVSASRSLALAKCQSLVFTPEFHFCQSRSGHSLSSPHRSGRPSHPTSGTGQRALHFRAIRKIPAIFWLKIWFICNKNLTCKHASALMPLMSSPVYSIPGPYSLLCMDSGSMYVCWKPQLISCWYPRSAARGGAAERGFWEIFSLSLHCH